MHYKVMAFLQKTRGRWLGISCTTAIVLIALHHIYGAAPDPVAGAISFAEVAKPAGVRFAIDSSPTPNKNQIEVMVAGVALLDYDGDGYQDIYFVNGAAIPSLQKEAPQYQNRLFHNNHDLTFTDVTDQAGVAGDGYSMGVAAGDYDNDGRPDLYVAGVSRNQLFHNNGDGTFTDVTSKAGVEGGSFEGKKMWSVAAAWVDYNNDGWPDLFVSNYVKWEVNKDPVCMVGGKRGYCNPQYYEPLPNTLYRNNGDGTFTDVSQETGISRYRGRGMGVAIADYDGDGFMDIFVANDKSPNFLFHNIGGKRFEEVAVPAMVAYNPDGKVVSGMGADFRDANNDARPDIWFTALSTELFPLLYYRGQGEFEDVTERTGLAWQTQREAGWSNAIVDLDNDGWKDLFVARSDADDSIERISSQHYEQPNAVFRNLGNGKFRDVSAGCGPDFQLPAAHRGAAVGDLDNDGRMDVVVSVLNGPAKIFHNITQNENHWMALELRGKKSNRMGIGARIALTTDDGAQQFNHVTTSVGYASSSDVRVHFGLGRFKTAKEITIQWPSGIQQKLHNLPADRVVRVEEAEQLKK
jgi:enediyne biosynthesis protein E4